MITQKGCISFSNRFVDNCEILKHACTLTSGNFIDRVLLRSLPSPQRLVCLVLWKTDFTYSFWSYYEQVC